MAGKLGQEKQQKNDKTKPQGKPGARPNNSIPILVSGGIFAALFVALICNMGYFVATNRQ